ncbi:hypothetical protein [Nitrococcus mobilis]|nr:hypothetical protein [Nitrococcus mobilis]
MNEENLPQRDRWARLRFTIIGALLAAPPPAGELYALRSPPWRRGLGAIRTTGLEIHFR